MISCVQVFKMMEKKRIATVEEVADYLDSQLKRDSKWTGKAVIRMLYHMHNLVRTSPLSLYAVFVLSHALACRVSWSISAPSGARFWTYVG